MSYKYFNENKAFSYKRHRVEAYCHFKFKIFRLFVWLSKGGCSQINAQHSQRSLNYNTALCSSRNDNNSSRIKFVVNKGK